jgi:hypothetical protein
VCLLQLLCQLGCLGHVYCCAAFLVSQQRVSTSSQQQLNNLGVAVD